MSLHPVTPALREWASKLAAARVGKQLSQTDLSRRTGAPALLISGLETGRTFGAAGANTSSKTVTKLRVMADVVGLPLPAEYLTDEALPVAEKRPYQPRKTVSTKTAKYTKTETISVSADALRKLVVTLVAKNEVSADGALALLSLASK